MGSRASQARIALTALRAFRERLKTTVLQSSLLAKLFANPIDDYRENMSLLVASFEIFRWLFVCFFPNHVTLRRYTTSNLH